MIVHALLLDSDMGVESGPEKLSLIYLFSFSFFIKEFYDIRVPHVEDERQDYSLGEAEADQKVIWLSEQVYKILADIDFL